MMARLMCYEKKNGVASLGHKSISRKLGIMHTCGTSVNSEVSEERKHLIRNSTSTKYPGDELAELADRLANAINST